MIRRIVIVAFYAVIFFFSVGYPWRTATAVEPIKWRFSTVFPYQEGNYGDNSFAYRWLADKIKERTQGRLVLNIGWSNSLGYKGPDILRAIKSNILESSEVTLPFHEVEVPWFGVLYITNLSKGPKSTKLIFEALRPLAEETFSKYDAILLAFFPQLGEGSQVTLWTNREIKTVQDFKGMKVRGFSKVHAECLLEKLGAGVVWIPTPEIQTALKTGIVDSVTNGGISLGWASRVAEVVKYAYEFSYPIPPIGFAIGVNRHSFERLPVDLQKIVKDTGRDFEEYAWKTSFEPESYGLAGREGIQAHLDKVAGHKFLWKPLPPSMMDQFYQMSKQFLDVYAKRAGSTGEKARELMLNTLGEK